MSIPVTVENTDIEYHGGHTRVIATIKTPAHKFRIQNHRYGGWTLLKKQGNGRWLVKSRTHPSRIGRSTPNEKAIITFTQEVKNGNHTDRAC